MLKFFNPGMAATRWRSAVALVLSLVTGLTLAAERIQPWAENSHYWSYRQKPVLLLGASRTHNLFQSGDIEKELDDILSFGGNYVRNTMSFREEGDVYPYVRGGQGFDLTQFNPVYWEKFEALLRAAQARDIVVQIEVWDIHDFHRESWLKNPFNPANRAVPEGDGGELPEVMGVHPSKEQNPFFSTVFRPEQNRSLLAIQEAFVRKLLSISLAYPNVLYCIDNESFVTPEWALHWAGVIRAEAARRGVDVEITEMWEPQNLLDEKHLNTIDNPQIYSFIDVSQNNHVRGQPHYDRAVYVVDRIAQRPRPVNNTKIYGSATSRFVDEDVAISSFWKSLFAGHAAVRFHREPSGLGTQPLARQSVQVARKLFGEFALFQSERCTDQLARRESDEAYCRRGGDEMVIYFPKRKADYNINTWRKLDRHANLSRWLVDIAEIGLPPEPSFTRATWYAVETGERVEQELVSDRPLSPPDNRHWVVHLR
jgi:hypothetical protein